MDVFCTPTFQAAHAERGGSPFAILTASQQATLYRTYDAAVLAFRDHPGSMSNDNRTDADVKALESAIGYLISAFVSFSLYLILFFLLKHFLRCLPTSPTVSFGTIANGTISFAVFWLSSTSATATLIAAGSPIISSLVPYAALVLWRTGFSPSWMKSAFPCISQYAFIFKFLSTF